MGLKLRVWIPGEPKGQPRPRAFAPGGHARVYDPGTAEGWKGLIALALRPHLHKLSRVVAEDPLAYDSPSCHVPIADVWSVEMLFKMPRPAAMRRKKPHPEDGETPHTKTPDIDNLAKAVLDACTSLRIWHDDAQVVELRARKVYHADKGGTPGLELVIQPYEGGEDGRGL